MKYDEEEIFKLRNTNKELKNELNCDLEEREKAIVSLKKQLDKAKNTE